MNELQIFNSQEFGSVRTITIDEEPWFVGKDVCQAFGDSNHKRSLSRLEDYEKGVTQIDTPGGKQNMTIINESGLYSLLFQMQPQKAKGVSQNDSLIEERIQRLHRFKLWVTSEVLPSIRKHGMYATAPTIDKIIDDPDYGIQLLQKLKEEREQRKHLETMNAVQAQQIEELQPKASYYDVVLNCKDLLSISKIAKDYGWSAIKMNSYLHERGVQFKQGDIWLLYQRYADKGYTNTKTHPYIGSDGETHTRVHTHWTQKGRLFIYDLLKADGVLPIIEREQNE